MQGKIAVGVSFLSISSALTLQGCFNSNDAAGPAANDAAISFDAGAYDAPVNDGSKPVDEDANPDGATSDAPADGAPDGPAEFSTTFQVAMSNYAACAVFPDGRLKCWGLALVSGSSAIGDGPNEMGSYLPAVTLPKRVRKVRAGASGPFCIIFEDGGLRCWGGSGLGQPTPSGINLDTITTNIDLGPGRTAIDVAPGSHTCAILDNGTVKCWGSNSEGQLGQGDTTSRDIPPVLPVDLGTGRTAKAITGGYAFSCALLDNDRVKCWGRGNNTVGDTGQGGELGIGGTAHIGNNPNEMGDNLPFAKLGTNPGTSQPWKVKKVAAGRTFACAILENDRVKCWGRNDGLGNLGSGDSQPYGNTLVDDAIPFVDVGSGAAPFTVSDLAVGEFAACVRLSNNGIRCWGTDAGYGTLGRGTANATIGDQTGEMGNQLVDVPLKTSRVPSALWAGQFSMCARVDLTTLNCWGSNSQGILGQGQPGTSTTSSIGDAPGEMGANLVETLLE